MPLSQLVLSKIGDCCCCLFFVFSYFFELTLLQPAHRVRMVSSVRTNVSVKIIQHVIMHLAIVTVYQDFKESFARKVHTFSQSRQ